jgi:hypothetical protein
VCDDGVTRGIFFFHNPKAGGTSIDRALGSCFHPQDRAPLIENSQRDHERNAGDYGRYAGYLYYAGHYGYDIYCQIAAAHAPVTNFRHPATRLVSLYRFFRGIAVPPQGAAERDDLYPVLFAQQVGLHDLICAEDPRIELYTRDHHVRQLTASAWSEGGSRDIAQACDLVDRMPWFYVCEHPGLSQAWADSVLPSLLLRAMPPIPAENRTVLPGREPPLERRTYRAICDRNELDFCLYAHATRRLLER